MAPAAANVSRFAILFGNEEIEKNDYNLSVSTYVEKEYTGEVIDIKVLNQEIAETVRKIDAFESFHK